MDQKPSIGRIVHYQHPKLLDRVEKLENELAEERRAYGELKESAQNAEDLQVAFNKDLQSQLDAERAVTAAQREELANLKSVLSIRETKK